MLPVCYRKREGGGGKKVKLRVKGRDDYTVNVDELIRKYDRYAKEWFMRAEDQRYWKQTKELVREKGRKITALIAVSAVIQLMAIVIICRRLRELR